ncbi:unnamed protein product [Amoebophrya sp. A25]|nr:unnamed protein product [Amoebophrya sp. A25]|eukprot:GSA25T00000214001.1
MFIYKGDKADRKSREYTTWVRGLDRDFSTKWTQMLAQVQRSPEILEVMLRILFHFVRYLKGNKASRAAGLVPLMKRIAADTRLGSLPRQNVRRSIHPRLSCLRVLWELQKQVARTPSSTVEATDGVEKKSDEQRMDSIFGRDLCPLLYELLETVTAVEIDDLLGPLILEIYDRGGEPAVLRGELVRLALLHENGRTWGENLLQFVNRRVHIREAASMLFEIIGTKQNVASATSSNHKEGGALLSGRDYLYSNDAAVMVDVLLRERNRQPCLELLQLFLRLDLVPKKRTLIEQALAEDGVTSVKN